MAETVNPVAPMDKTNRKNLHRRKFIRDAVR